MKAYIVTHPLGVFAFNEEGKLITFKRFSTDPKVVAEKFFELKQLYPEEKDIIEELEKKGFNEFVFSVKKESKDERIKFDPNNIGEREFRKKIRDGRRRIGWVSPAR